MSIGSCLHLCVSLLQALCDATVVRCARVQSTWWFIAIEESHMKKRNRSNGNGNDGTKIQNLFWRWKINSEPHRDKKEVFAYANCHPTTTKTKTHTRSTQHATRNVIELILTTCRQVDSIAQRYFMGKLIITIGASARTLLNGCEGVGDRGTDIRIQIDCSNSSSISPAKELQICTAFGTHANAWHSCSQCIAANRVPLFPIEADKRQSIRVCRVKSPGIFRFDYIGVDACVCLCVSRARPMLDGGARGGV